MFTLKWMKGWAWIIFFLKIQPSHVSFVDGFQAASVLHRTVPIGIAGVNDRVGAFVWSFVGFKSDCAEDHSLALTTAFVITIKGDVCLYSNRSWLRAFQIIQIIQEKMSPVIPVGGKQIHFADSFNASSKEKHDIEKKGVRRGGRSQTWEAKVQWRKRWSIDLIPPQKAQLVFWITPRIWRLSPVGIASCRIFQIAWSSANILIFGSLALFQMYLFQSRVDIAFGSVGRRCDLATAIAKHMNQMLQWYLVWWSWSPPLPAWIIIILNKTRNNGVIYMMT